MDHIGNIISDQLEPVFDDSEANHVFMNFI